MPRPPTPDEVRAIKALRQAGAITREQQDEAIRLLEATEPCTKCEGTGNSHSPEFPPGCNRCENTGQMRVIR